MKNKIFIFFYILFPIGIAITGLNFYFSLIEHYPKWAIYINACSFSCCVVSFFFNVSLFIVDSIESTMFKYQSSKIINSLRDL